MGFGDADPRAIVDPLFEPLWAGRRVLVEVAERGARLRDVGALEESRTAELRGAIAAACLADELVLDGYLVAGPLPGSDDAPPPRPAAEVTRSGILRQVFLGSLARSRRPRATESDDQRVVSLPGAGPIAFAAVDVLWLDGEPLLDVPLGERKRLLESAVVDGDLVRRTVAVRAPVEHWQGQWRALGFEAMAVKAANSRYVPGGRSREWTIVPIRRP